VKTRVATIRSAAGLCALPLLGGCATLEEPEYASAFRDFIEVTDLQEVRSIRTFGGIDGVVLNAEYVITTTREGDYLVEYAGPCGKDLFTRGVKPDVRRDGHRIHAGIDTFRGCRIRALYEVTPDQVVELRDLGKAPGEDPP
jgi:hypothetical protein